MKCKDIKSSYLKTPISILALQTGTDEYGISKATWNEKKVSRAWLVTSTYKNREFLQANGTNALEIKDAIIRFTDVSFKDRVSINGVLYKVSSIINIEEKNKYLQLTLEVLRNG